MAIEVPLISVNLATVCAESFFYGIFFILFLLSTYLFTAHTAYATSGPSGHRSGSKNYRAALKNPFIIASALISLSITAHWFLTCIRLFMAFVIYQHGNSPLAFYADLTQPTEVVKTGFLMVSLVLGDAMIIYRLWVVWGYNKVVIVFPCCTLIGLCVCGIGITYQFTQYKPGQDVFLSEAGRWITSDAVFTLCTNVYSTVAISWRIWRINRDAQRLGSRSLLSILGIIVESASIYTAWTTFFFASYQSQSNLQFVAVDCWPAMSGIAFMLINVRVGLGWAQKSVVVSSTSTGTTLNNHSNGSGGRSVPRSEYPLRPVAINIQRSIDTDLENSSIVDKNHDYQLAE